MRGIEVKVEPIKDSPTPKWRVAIYEDGVYQNEQCQTEDFEEAENEAKRLQEDFNKY